jgi:hypothetical protein
MPVSGQASAISDLVANARYGVAACHGCCIQTCAVNVGSGAGTSAISTPCNGTEACSEGLNCVRWNYLKANGSDIIRPTATNTL